LCSLSLGRLSLFSVVWPSFPPSSRRKLPVPSPGKLKPAETALLLSECMRVCECVCACSRVVVWSLVWGVCAVVLWAGWGCVCGGVWVCVCMCVCVCVSVCVCVCVCV